MPQDKFDENADFRSGRAVREEVLGKAHVDRSLARAEQAEDEEIE